MTEARTFLLIFQKNILDPHRERMPTGFMEFTRDYERDDLEPYFSLNFRIQDEETELEFSIGIDEVDALIAALIKVRRVFLLELAEHQAGDPDDNEVSCGEKS